MREGTVEHFPGEHHLHEEHDHLGVLEHLGDILEDPLAGRPEVEPDEEEHGRGGELEREQGCQFALLDSLETYYMTPMM